MAREYSVTGGGGVALHVRECGDPDGAAIVFVHGWSQCDRCWDGQLEGQLGASFRLVAFDIRGHGMSDKPPDPVSYADRRLWADDLAAVIDGSGLERPVVVAWSYGGFIVADYASQIDDYSGEKFVVDPQTVPETRGGGEIVKTRLQQASGRTVIINYLVRGGKVIDVYLNGTISDLATRRDEFASIIAAGGADGLVRRLHERTQTLLAR